LPKAELPRVPRAALLWSRGLVVASVLMTLYTLDRLTVLFADYWLFDSLGVASVFWTNFWMGAELYVAAFLLFTIAIAAPAYLTSISRRNRRFVVNTALLVASVAAYMSAQNYTEFLLGGKGFEFGSTDPVFRIDIGFYAFNLPNLWIAWRYFMWAAVLNLGFSVACANVNRNQKAADLPVSRLSARAAISATGSTRVALLLTGLVAAAGWWLTRYDLLLKNNSDAASIKRGAQYLDVTGLFSSLHYIWATTFVILGVTVALFFMLKALDGQGSADWRHRFRKAWRVAVWLVVFDFGFKCGGRVRHWLFCQPHEPVIQLPYIARHVDATRRAYNLEHIQEVDFLPNRPGDPLPTAESLLASPTLKNAPLWPGFVSYLERWIDRQHAQRILQTQGSSMVYGPTLELFQQQQKLRTYYNFVNVDNARYWIDGKERMFVSA